MVAQQKIKDNLAESVETPTGDKKANSVLPKSRLSILKKSATKTKAPNNNDPFRFQGKGVDFKGKLIGERDVNEARGDSMCAEAMRLAKAAVKTSGTHKQRIILNISIDGLRMKEEKTGTILNFFPVSRISFIARDTTDARAFGFIFGTTDKKYKFYGIKTAQTADNAVLSIRDMFQVVFEMKKKQIEEVKQKKEEEKNVKREEENNFRIEDGVPVADLLDLESELQVIEQGFNQLQNIPSMPEDTAWPGNASSFNNDPFGDSFAPPVVNSNSLNLSNGIQPVFSGSPVQPFSNFSDTNPFVQTSNLMTAADPFDTQSAQRVINAINANHAFNLPPPPQRQTGFGSDNDTSSHISSATSANNDQIIPDTNWGVSSSSASSFKENSAPIAFENPPSFADFTKNTQSEWIPPTQQKVTTLEEAFSKLIDMDALVSGNGTGETKKNPFEHIINPPKLPLNALSTVPPKHASAVSNGISRDPFNDEFFS